MHDIADLPLPFPDARFDEIVCKDILEHVEYADVLREAVGQVPPRAPEGVRQRLDAHPPAARPQQRPGPSDVGGRRVGRPGEAAQQHLVEGGAAPVHPHRAGLGLVEDGAHVAERELRVAPRRLVRRQLLEREAGAGEGVRPVLRFVEKPDADTARGYLDSGDYYWNSGMFL